MLKLINIAIKCSNRFIFSFEQSFFLLKFLNISFLSFDFIFKLWNLLVLLLSNCLDNIILVFLKNIFDLREHYTAKCRLREVDVLQLLFGVFLFERVTRHQMHLLQALEELISKLAYYSTITSELRSINWLVRRKRITADCQVSFTVFKFGHLVIETFFVLCVFLPENIFDELWKLPIILGASMKSIKEMIESKLLGRELIFQ
jgi:hypothetical protein